MKLFLALPAHPTSPLKPPGPIVHKRSDETASIHSGIKDQVGFAVSGEVANGKRSHPDTSAKTIILNGLKGAIAIASHNVGGQVSVIVVDHGGEVQIAISIEVADNDRFGADHGVGGSGCEGPPSPRPNRIETLPPWEGSP